MLRALPGSLLAHAAVLGMALVGFTWPEPDDAPAAAAVSVNIITMANVSANATEVVQSDSTVNLVSSGVTAVTPSTIEPLPAEVIEPVEAVQPEPQAVVERAPQAVAEGQAMEMAALTSPAVNSLASQPLAAAAPATIEPVSSEDLKIAPVPRVLSFERPSRPTAVKPPEQTPRPAPAQPSGNGGTNDGDAVAAVSSSAQRAGSGDGGNAEIAKYPSDVLRKLRRALRSSNGPAGEVVMRFTVLADGRVSGVSIGRSSGNAAVDQAGLATVSRAAPFPPIPPAAGLSDWTFDVPLAFGG
jgi:protein TonB